MLARFFQSRRVPAWRPALPPDRRVYAIGDVHGCLSELDRLLALIDRDEAERGGPTATLIFIGDLIDRGPASAQVLDRVIGLRGTRDVRVLCGNHEEVFLAALLGDEKALRLFCRIGGHETALSYGIAPAAYELADYPTLAAILARHVPETHLAFLAGLEDMIVLGDYAFVHAGIRPDLPLDEQRGEDLRWIREPFLAHGRPLGHMVVHGHTIAAEVERRAHRIGIDTGACRTGRLTALGLQDDESWLLQT